MLKTGWFIICANFISDLALYPVSLVFLRAKRRQFCVLVFADTDFHPVQTEGCSDDGEKDDVLTTTAITYPHLLTY